MGALIVVVWIAAGGGGGPTMDGFLRAARAAGLLA